MILEKLSNKMNSKKIYIEILGIGKDLRLMDKIGSTGVGENRRWKGKKGEKGQGRRI